MLVVYEGQDEVLVTDVENENELLLFATKLPAWYPCW